jgi:hypothetical protein
MTTEPTLIEKQDVSILLNVCPQRLGALADTLHLTPEDAMRACQANGLTVFTLGGAEWVAARAPRRPVPTGYGDGLAENGTPAQAAHAWR